ncbi:MAG: hypothetical protein IT424_15905, partial [Pirellulales bacterium]|nr:hypothetical protein [Pirellulales bacterium]
YASALNAFEALCRPTRVADLNTAKVTAFAVELRHERKRRDGSPAPVSWLTVDIAAGLVKGLCRVDS